MIEEHEKLNEPADFAAYKMRQLIEECAASGQLEAAHALQDALDKYLLGNMALGFAKGWPYNPDTGEYIT